ncbi:hypothetical protein CsSME_00038214 [Camellia sinensis var. sinensis]
MTSNSITSANEKSRAKTVNKESRGSNVNNGILSCKECGKQHWDAAYQGSVLDVVREGTWLNLARELIRTTLGLMLVRLVLFLPPSSRKCSEH